MAGPGAGGVTLVDGTARTGAVDTGQVRSSLGVNTGGRIVTLGESAVGGRLGTFGDGPVKLGWTETGGAGHGAMVAEAVGGMEVTLEKMRDSAWMAEN